jgi:hypothetical protein
MTDRRVHEVQIVAASPDDIKQLLGIDGDLPAEGELAVADGLTMSGLRLSRSSGFDGTQYILEAVMTIGTSVSSTVLSAWLLDRLKGRRNVTATVDGDEVEPARDS